MEKIDYNLLRYFIGPEAENISFLQDLISKSINHHKDYRQKLYPDSGIEFYQNYRVSEQNQKKFEIVFDEFLKRLEISNRSFHPRYFAQMTKDPAIPALVGMFVGSLFNPNNHAYEGGPATTEMEMEVVEMLKKLVGYKEGWGHLTSGGSLANLEALWAVRDMRKSGKVLFSKGCHYSWKRICSILRIDNFEEINVDKAYRIDLNHLEESLKKNETMIVIANLGTTGCGAVDDLESILELRNLYGFHLHIDAAYGGFIRSLILDDENKTIDQKEQVDLKEYTFKQLSLVAESDSLTIDPHKHGLIPYGAGAVLYKDEKLREVILNTSPYTYHKTDKPNIGTFTLEGSRPGAIAAACWLTYNLIPLNKDGIGKIIVEGIKSAKSFNARINKTKSYRMLCNPDLDIVCFYKYDDNLKLKELNKINVDIYLKQSIENLNGDFIFSKFYVSNEIIKNFICEEQIDDDQFVTLRAVLFKHWMLLGEGKNYLDLVFEVLEKS